LGSKLAVCPSRAVWRPPVAAQDEHITPGNPNASMAPFTVVA